MTQSELKELTNLGAELGAAKAEVERLREALRWYEEKVTECRKIGSLGDNARQALDRDGGFRARDALSQQTEPTDAFTAVDMATAAAQAFRDGQAAVEQAAAQDEREVAAVIGFYEGERDPRLLSWNVLPNGEHRLYTRPAQTEQRPIGWITEDYLTDKSATTYSPEVADRWRAKGWPVSEIYAAPIAQTAPNSDCEWCAGAGKDHFGEKCEHCHAAPQPEQSGLVGQVCGGDGTHNTVNVAVAGPVPWGDLRIGTPVRLIPAPAQGAGDASA